MGSRIEAVSGADDNSSEKAAKGAGKIRFGLRMKFSLAIIVLVATVLLTMSIYFVLREIRLLRSQIFESVQRELVHLSNTAQESIGVDELAIIASISDLKKLDYLSYAFVLNARGEIIQYFDNRAERAVGAKPSDGVERDLEKRKENVNPGIVEYDDPRDPAGTIFDFSRPVLNKFDRKNIGYVAIGLSDIIIRREVANVYRIIGLISLAFLGLSIVGAVILSSVTIKPIRKLSRGAAIIGQGGLDSR
jgi:hypothetical protein